jgi:hypothetical protein
VAWLPAHALFWTGDITCRVLNRIPDWEAKPVEWISGLLYRTYNRCMLLSLRLNDWAELSIWKRDSPSPDL